MSGVGSGCGISKGPDAAPGSIAALLRAGAGGSSDAMQPACAAHTHALPLLCAREGQSQSASSYIDGDRRALRSHGQEKKCAQMTPVLPPQRGGRVTVGGRRLYLHDIACCQVWV
ncbi:hypothetical protein ACJQWK_04028 [Exserohilum turcicum]